MSNQIHSRSNHRSLHPASHRSAGVPPAVAGASRPRTHPHHASRRLPLALTIHLVPHKPWTPHNPEVAILSIHQIKRRRLIQFLQVRQIQHRPQPAIRRRFHQLIQIWQVSFKQFSRYANRHIRCVRGNNTLTLHDSPWLKKRLRTNDQAYSLDAQRPDSCAKSRKENVIPGNRRDAARSAAVEKNKPGTGDLLHTQEPVTVASFRTWRGWREYVA